MSKQLIRFGRRKFSIARGKARLMSTTVTERALPGEKEEAFTARLLEKYAGVEGTLEIVIKSGEPDYAILTFDRTSL